MITVRAVARGWYRGQRFRPGMTVQVPADTKLEPWMELAPGEDAPNAPRKPVAVSELGKQRAVANAKAQIESRPGLFAKPAKQEAEPTEPPQQEADE